MTSHRRSLAFFLPSLAGGGAERAMLNLASAFAARGVRTDLVLARAEGPYLSLVPPAVRVVDLNVPRVLRALVPFAAYLRRERPSAVLAALHHCSLVAMVAARTIGARTRTVISIQNTLGQEVRNSTDVRVRAVPGLFRVFQRWADLAVAVSDGVADDFAQVTRMNRSRIEVIHNPIITPALLEMAAGRCVHPWFQDGGDPVVLGVGRLTIQKNFPALIEAFALVSRKRGARLVILGEGPDRTSLEARVSQLGLRDRVALPGFVDNPHACMARAGVFVLSSNFEGLPTVLVESLALGTPVVSTDCESGPREILKQGALGELVPVADVPALADAILKVLDKRPAPPSAEDLRPYTLDSVVDRFQEVFTRDA
jgi:glycosyltransferase involved in cell wall biosynthesis